MGIENEYEEKTILGIIEGIGEKKGRYYVLV